MSDLQADQKISKIASLFGVETLVHIDFIQLTKKILNLLNAYVLIFRLPGFISSYCSVLCDEKDDIRM